MRVERDEGRDRGGWFPEDQPWALRRDSALRARGVGADERILLVFGVESAALVGCARCEAKPRRAFERVIVLRASETE